MRNLIQRNMVYLVALAAGVAFLFTAGVGYAASPAFNQARNTCLIGEQSNGYLGVVSGKSASAAVVREMNSINQQRKSAYANLARRNGVTVDDTGRLAARQLIARAKPGQCVRDANGAWREVKR